MIYLGTIITKLPSPFLSKNKPTATRGSRFRRWRLVKQAREDARDRTKALTLYPVPFLIVQPKFYYSTNRRRDGQNLLHLIIAHVDGIVDSGLVRDDNTDYLRIDWPKVEIDKLCPRLELWLYTE